jgi:hypothetical protein
MKLEPFYIKKNNIYAIPVTHYNMEMAAQVRLAFLKVNPACVAVELAETIQAELLHAASRLPDISVVMMQSAGSAYFYLCEPCDGAFEGLRSALETGIPAYCIDLDADRYPNIKEPIPDPYAVQRVGLDSFYDAYETHCRTHGVLKTPLDADREIHMAKRLKELSLLYDSVLFVGGMAHVSRILDLIDKSHFPNLQPVTREQVQVCALTETSCREVMAEFPWLTCQYEAERVTMETLPDRQKLILRLFNVAAEKYVAATGNPFPRYNTRNIMKFLRNYALIYHRLMPDLFQILSAAKGCVDHNFAYEVWNLATDYPFRKNTDNLPELNLTVEDVWGKSKIIRFHRKEQSRKPFGFRKRGKDRSQIRFKPPGPFAICSYQPEDLIIESFADFLKKKGTQIFTEDAARTVPFSTSIEDGIDTRETIRHWHEKKIYVKVRGKPPGGVGSIVIIFDEDFQEEGKKEEEKYPWKTTWLGEHTQESDMAFYATSVQNNVVGPGISRCEYGGFMMSYPPRRLFDVWSDPDYRDCRSKPEVLLMAAIDYAVKPLIVYVASKPPRTAIKSFASRFGKKIVFMPIGQLSPIKINQIRAFHVLDGYDKRQIADEYIY